MVHPTPTVSRIVGGICRAHAVCASATFGDGSVMAGFRSESCHTTFAEWPRTRGFSKMVGQALRPSPLPYLCTLCVLLSAGSDRRHRAAVRSIDPTETDPRADPGGMT